MKKQTAIISGVIWGVTAIILTVVMCVGIIGNNFSGFFNNNWSYYDDENYTVGSAAVNGEQINKVKIDWVNGEVEIKPTASSEITFEESGASNLNDKDKMRYKLDGDTLSIIFCGNKPNWSFMKKSNKKLVVNIPENKKLSELSIDSVSANITIEKADATLLNIDNVSGFVSVKNASVIDFDFETISGDLDYNGEYQKLDAESVSANISSTLSVCPREVSLQSVSGNIAISIPENDGFTFAYDKVSGSFSSDFDMTLGDDRYIYKNGLNKFDVETVSGNVKIQKNK